MEYIILKISANAPNRRTMRCFFCHRPLALARWMEWNHNRLHLNDVHGNNNVVGQNEALKSDHVVGFAGLVTSISFSLDPTQQSKAIQFFHCECFIQWDWLKVAATIMNVNQGSLFFGLLVLVALQPGDLRVHKTSDDRQTRPRLRPSFEHRSLPAAAPTLSLLCEKVRMN